MSSENIDANQFPLFPKTLVKDRCHDYKGTRKSGLESRKGRRATMEDTETIADNFCALFSKDIKTQFGLQNKFDRKEISLYAVYDGHGGRKTAKLLQEHYPTVLAKCLLECDTPSNALRTSFLEMNRRLDDEFDVMDGSTAVVALLIGSMLYVANVGDAECVLVTNGLTATCLTRKHTPKDVEEVKRIEASGGHVYNGRVEGSLAVSRAFGDFHISRAIVADPFVTETDLQKTEASFLIVACDGLWESDVFTYQSAASFVTQTFLQLEASRPNDSVEETSKGTFLVQEVTERMVDYAIQGGSTDNVTAMIVVLQ